MPKEKLRDKKLLICLVLVPLVLLSIYFSLFALDRYVSNAQVAVRQVGSNEAPTVPGLAVMLSGMNPTSREETLYLREFLGSQDMLNVLEEKLGWAEHYQSRKRDPRFWLSKDAAKEDVLDFYRRMVSAHFDEQTGLLSVQVQAYEPQFAHDVLKVILGESERFVNELSHRMAREQMIFAQRELAKARETFEDKREALLVFQAENNILDAEASAKSKAEVISGLEAMLTKERTTLKSLLSNLGANTPQVRQQRTRIRSLEQQLEIEMHRLVASSSDGKLNVVASKYRNLMIDASIAEEAYKFAVSSVESSRIEASKKLRSLITIVAPNYPDKAIYPERIYNLLVALIVVFLLYGIAKMIVASIQDHKD